MAFLLHFKEDGTIFFLQKNGWFFIYIAFYYIYCVILSNIPFTFPQTTKCFLSNGTKNMHILASGPEQQAVRFGYVILGEHFKKGVDPLTADLVDLLPYAWVFGLTKILSGGGAKPFRILNTRHVSVYCTRFLQLRSSCFLRM